MNSLQMSHPKYTGALKSLFAYSFVSRKHHQILHFDSLTFTCRAFIQYITRFSGKLPKIGNIFLSKKCLTTFLPTPSKAFPSEQGPVTFRYQAKPEKNEQQPKENNQAFSQVAMKLVVLPLLSIDSTHLTRHDHK